MNCEFCKEPIEGEGVKPVADREWRYHPECIEILKLEHAHVMSWVKRQFAKGELMVQKKPCPCECHKGKNIYHVRWKACCATPVDGGTLSKVWGCKMKDGEVRFLIAKDKAEVAEYWKKEFGLEPMEETVDIAE